jgi:hypothetical protein
MPVAFTLPNNKWKPLTNNLNLLLNFKIIKNVYLVWPDLLTAECPYNQAWEHEWQKEKQKSDTSVLSIYPMCVL